MTKDELTKKTLKELLVLAQRKGLRGVSRLRKAQLVAKLLDFVATAPAVRASRVRTTPRKRSSKTTTDLTQQTRKQLLTVAQQRGLTGVSRLRKEQLIARLAEVPFTVPPTVPPIPYLSPEPEPLHASESAPLAKAPQPVTEPFPSSELPSTYPESRVVLLAQDPRQLYTYWDLGPEQIHVMPSSSDTPDTQLVARVIEETNTGINGTGDQSIAEITLTPATMDAYIPVPQPDTAYRVEVGYQAADGQFTALGRSNVATTPAADISANTEVRWFTPPGYIPSPPPAIQTPLFPAPLDHEPGSQHLAQGAREELPSSAVPSITSPLFSWSLNR
jgi:hypothetical protein